MQQGGEKQVGCLQGKSIREFNAHLCAKISKMTLRHQTAGEFIANQIANQIPIQLFIGAVGIKFQQRR